MKKIFLIASLAVVLAAGMTALPSASQAQSLGADLSGRILIAVEANGEAWYVDPGNQERYYLGRPADAFSLMQNLGLGITNENFNSFNGQAPARLSGRILLKVQDSGMAYYVNPVDHKLYFLGKPADAFRLMGDLGLGITNNNLNKIPVFANTVVTENVQISNYSFSPANLIVSRGSMVTWSNNGSIAHTVNSPGNFTSSNIEPGQTFSRIFNNVGRYNYHCSIHPSMTGTITVE